MSAAMSTEAALAPVTKDRPVCTDLETSIVKPYMVRALVAPDKEHPDGTPGHMHNDRSVLQQHCAFFDQDNDGIIYPWETYAGFRKLGFNMIASLLLALFINVAMSYSTLPVSKKGGFLLLYSPYTFVTYIRPSMEVILQPLIRKEDSPVTLENIFSKYGKKYGDKLTYNEVWNMTEANRLPFDFFGWLASKVEWLTLYHLAKDEEGLLSKEAVRRCFDGSLFEYMAKMQMGAQGKKMK